MRLQSLPSVHDLLFCACKTAPSECLCLPCCTACQACSTKQLAPASTAAEVGRSQPCSQTGKPTGKLTCKLTHHCKNRTTVCSKSCMQRPGQPRRGSWSSHSARLWFWTSRALCCPSPSSRRRCSPTLRSTCRPSWQEMWTGQRCTPACASCTPRCASLDWEQPVWGLRARLCELLLAVSLQARACLLCSLVDCGPGCGSAEAAWKAAFSCCTVSVGCRSPVCMHLVELGCGSLWGCQVWHCEAPLVWPAESPCTVHAASQVRPNLRITVCTIHQPFCPVLSDEPALHQPCPYPESRR